MSKRSSEAGEEKHCSPEWLSVILFFKVSTRDNAPHLCNFILKLGSRGRALRSRTSRSGFSSHPLQGKLSRFSCEICLRAYHEHWQGTAISIIQTARSFVRAHTSLGASPFICFMGQNILTLLPSHVPLSQPLYSCKNSLGSFTSVCYFLSKEREKIQ